MILLLIVLLATALLDLSGILCDADTERILYTGDVSRKSNTKPQTDSATLAEYAKSFIFSDKRGDK